MESTCAIRNNIRKSFIISSCLSRFLEISVIKPKTLSSKITPQLDVRESAQEVQHIHCHQLTYTILSPLEEYYTVLIFTAVKRSIAEINEREFITKQTRYCDHNYGGHSGVCNNELIGVNLMPCPPGFLLNASDPLKCDCNHQLRSLPDVTCKISSTQH